MGFKMNKTYEKIIYLTAFIVPVLNIPQLLKIWVEKTAEGVSFISWISFSIFSAMWFVYGIMKKDKNIIIMYFLLMLIQLFIAIGVLIY